MFRQLSVLVRSKLSISDMKNQQQKLKTQVKTELITFIASSWHIRRGRIGSLLKCCVGHNVHKVAKETGE